MPFVAEPGSKTKLSKRKLDKYLKNADFKALNDLGSRIAEKMGMPVDAETFNPVIIDFYQRVGFLPEAIINYLVLLGWSLDDKTEQFSTEAADPEFLVGTRQQVSCQLRRPEAAGHRAAILRCDSP